MKIKSIIKRFIVLVLLCVFAFSMLGSTDPLSKKQFESVDELAQEITADCYYFDIDLLQTNLNTIDIYKYILRPRNSCDVEYGYSVDLGYLITGGISEYYENSHGSAISVHASFDKNERVKRWPSEASEPYARKITTNIDSKEYICFGIIISLGIWVVLNFEIDDIIYTIEFYSSEKWVVGEGDNKHQITDNEKNEILDKMIADVQDGLFERIYNTGRKKDGTKLVN